MEHKGAGEHFNQSAPVSAAGHNKPEPADHRPSPNVAFDPDDYRADLAELKLTRAQEEELLQTLWTIMSAFVDLGWGVDSVQTVLPGLADLFPETAPDAVKSIASPTNNNAESEPQDKEEP